MALSGTYDSWATDLMQMLKFKIQSKKAELADKENAHVLSANHASVIIGINASLPPDQQQPVPEIIPAPDLSEYQAICDLINTTIALDSLLKPPNTIEETAMIQVAKIGEIKIILESLLGVAEVMKTLAESTGIKINTDQYEASPGEAGKMQRAMMVLPLLKDSAKLKEIQAEMANPTKIV